MTGFISLLFFGGAAFVGIKLWQQHERRAPIRDLEERREDLKDLEEEADLKDEIRGEEDALRERGVDVNGQDEPNKSEKE